jgi:hypothetical protein
VIPCKHLWKFLQGREPEVVLLGCFLYVQFHCRWSNFQQLHTSSLFIFTLSSKDNQEHSPKLLSLPHPEITPCHITTRGLQCKKLREKDENCRTSFAQLHWHCGPGNSCWGEATWPLPTTEMPAAPPQLATKNVLSIAKCPPRAKSLLQPIAPLSFRIVKLRFTRTT